MINPIIFRWFRIVLKWEVILICALFTMITPWHSAYAAGIIVDGSISFYTVTDSGFRNYQFAQFYMPDGSLYPRTDLCRLRNSSTNYYQATDSSNIVYGYCATNPTSGTRYYPDGYRIDPNGDTTNNPFPGSPLNCEADKIIQGVGYPSSSGSGSSSTSYDGCEAIPVGVALCRVDTSESGGWRCVGDVRLTGNAPPPETPEVVDSPDISTDPLDNVSGSETSNTDVEPTVTQPDGTTIDVTTVTDVQVAASGVSISENDLFITIVESAGVTTETETVTTVTVNPDGSYSERTNTTVTITNPGGIRTRITKADGSVTVSVIPSGSRTDTTTRTDYFDAGGNKIGSTGSSGSSGDGPVTVPGIGSGQPGQGGDGEGLGAFCDWADIVCQLAEWFFDEPLFPDNPEIPFVEIDADDFDSGIGAGQCPADNIITTQFGSLPISWALPCQFAETFRPVLLFFAWITALYIVVRVK